MQKLGKKLKYYGRKKLVKPLDKQAESILKELNLNPKECLWDCRGTWVMLHRYIELAGVKRGISMDSLEVIESNQDKGIAVVKCVASKDGVSVTSFGEVNPKNNRNSYPMAMAEKRAIDRAYLKLLGLHGFIYAEDEMNIIEEEKPKPSKRIVNNEREYIVFDEESNQVGLYNSFQTYAQAVQDVPFNDANKKEIKKHVNWVKSSECAYSDKAKTSALNLITTNKTQHIINEGE
tara:strand:- start:499 stop:1200 length:702 start_codon:yes stop_codon:yes gene_type:complete